MSAPPLDPAALGLVEDYLARLAGALGQRDRATRDLVAEVRDGLLAAIERDVADGRSAVAAARQAVRQSGAVEQVAPVLRADVVATRSQGTALALLRTGPFAAAAWLATVIGSQVAPWQVGTTSPWRTVAPWLGLGVLVTLACSLLANTAASSARCQSPNLARHAAMAAAVSCAVTDVAGLALLAVWAVAAPALLAWPAAAAAAVSGARIVFAGRRVRRLRLTPAV